LLLLLQIIIILLINKKLAEKNLINEALKKSEEFHLEQTMLDDKLKATDWEATNEEIMELVARESYLQWLKDNEKRSMDRNSLNLYCDQIPSNQNAHCSTWEQNNSNFMGVCSSRGDTSQLYHQHNNNNRLHTSHHSTTATTTTTSSNQPRSPSQSKLSNQLKTSPLNSKSNDTLIMLNSNDEKNQIKNTLISTNTNSAKNNNNIPTTSNNKQQTDNNLFMYDENMQYYETKSIINELPPDLFGLNTTDWIGIDNANEGSDSDILAQVLAASQMEYLESLKAKRQSSKNN
jgi:OTU domain-containing protein 5